MNTPKYNAAIGKGCAGLEVVYKARDAEDHELNWIPTEIVDFNITTTEAMVHKLKSALDFFNERQIEKE